MTLRALLLRRTKPNTQMPFREGGVGQATVMLILAPPQQRSHSQGQAGACSCSTGALALWSALFSLSFFFFATVRAVGWQVGGARPDLVECHVGRGFSLINSLLIWAHPDMEAFFPDEENCLNSQGRFAHEDRSERQTALHLGLPRPGAWSCVYKQVSQMGPCKWAFFKYLLSKGQLSTFL